MDRKKRAVVIIKHNNPTIIHRGPERQSNEISKIAEDRAKLEKKYPPNKGMTLLEGEPEYKGDTDPIFD